MKIKAVILIALIATLSFSCSSIKVTTDRHPEVELKGSTFSIRGKGQEEGLVQINDINKRRIEEGLMTELERKGLSSSETPDFNVEYGLAISVERYFNANHNHYGAYWGRRGFYGPGVGTTTITEHEVKRGDLIIEVRDGSSGEMIWYGVGSKALSTNNKNLDDKINRAIQRILEDFNPQVPQQTEDNSKVVS